MSYNTQIKIGSPVFAQLTHLPNLLYYAFQSARHTQVPVPVGAFTSPRNTCSLDPTDAASKTASRLVQPFLHNLWPKKCMEYEVEGSRPRGRPKRTWKEVVQKDCQARNLIKEDAMDCGRWKKLIKIG